MFRKHFKQIFKLIVPEIFLKWKELHQFFASSLSSTDKLVILSGVELFSIISKHYTTIRKTSLAYDNTLTNNYEFLTKLMQNLLFNIDNDTAIYISHLIKILECSISKDLPKIFHNTDKLVCWIEFLLSIIKVKLSPELEKYQEENQLITQNVLWKIKIQSFRTLFKLFQKYGIDFGTKKSISKVAFLFNDKYASILIEMNFALLYSSIDKYLPKEIVSIIFEFFSLFIKREQFIHIIEQPLDKLINIGVNQILITQNNYEQFKISPKNYLYSQFDVNDDENYYDARFSFSRFLKIICECKKQDEKGNHINDPIYFNYIYSHLLCLLKSFDEEFTKGSGDVRYKEAILYLIQSLKDFIFL